MHPTRTRPETRRRPRWASVVPRAALFVVLVLGIVVPTDAPAAPSYAAIVVDGADGRVLHARSADSARYPASLVKMMTLYMTFEAIEAGKLDANEKLRVSSRAASRPPSRLGLDAGDRIRVSDAVLALITKSANDAAVVLAEKLAGSESAFAKRMTTRARMLGMRRTTFRNASGLPDRGQTTTARDMAYLARALVRDFPDEYARFATRSFSYQGRLYPNHNGLLGKVAGVDGIKTGYIRASGFNLVTSAERAGRRVIAVVFGGRTARTRDAAATKLVELGFARLPEAPALAAVAPAPFNPRRAATLALASVEDGGGPELHAAAVKADGPAAGDLAAVDAALSALAGLPSVGDAVMPAFNPRR